MKSLDLFWEAHRPENFKLAKETIKKLEPDTVYGPDLMAILNLDQAETRMFVLWAAKKLKPKRYLEIGTRRGWSLAMVAVAASECDLYCFDRWDPYYGGVDNPGPEFITSEMSKLGYTKQINFISGDSRETVPKFLSDNQEMTFDLVLVDGDHEVDGAIADLQNVMPRISKGGVLIFDDIITCDRLDEVFYGLKDTYPDFEYHAWVKNKPGVGIAIKR